MNCSEVLPRRNIGALDYWLTPEQLSTNRSLDIRNEYLHHRSRLVIIDSFLRNDRAENLSNFLALEADYEEMYAISSGTQNARGCHVSREEWERTVPGMRLFHFDRARLPNTYGVGASLFLKCLTDLRGDGFRSFFESISGVRLGVCHVEAHRMTEGSFVGPHSDNRADRKLALVHYLSGRDARSQGGSLNVRSWSNECFSISPEFNRLVLFDVAEHAEHNVTPLVGPWCRLSVNAWYLAEKSRHTARPC